MIFTTEAELTAVLTADKNSQIGRLRDALTARTFKNTAEPQFVQSGDTQEWWHLCWERMSDAAYTYCLLSRAAGADREKLAALGADSEKIAVLGKWIHDRTIETVRLPADVWVGPWFRKRTSPLTGQLETAHVVNAVSAAYDLCPSLFTDEEKTLILSALREKGLDLCYRFIVEHRRGNWHLVLCGGYATAAVMLGDEDAVKISVDEYNFSTGYYDADGYGETLQYGNYASLSLSHMREVLVRYRPALTKELPLDAIAHTIKWAAASLFYMKPLGGERGGAVYPRSANFGDCAAIFRPTGNVLTQIAAEYDDPEIAGLARWLFNVTYADPSLGPDELATFGFFNHYAFESLQYLLHAVEPLSPSDIGMPEKCIFKTGSGIIRERWDNPETILAVQAGYDTHNCGGHRHADQNSFILVHRRERFFADPGHCCYRLETWRNSTKTAWHNTWDFIDEAGKTYTQASVKYNASPLNRNITYLPENYLVRADEGGAGIDVLSSDCAKAYGDGFLRCERVFVTAFPNVMFMIDFIETEQPMKVVSHFVLNNRDNQLNVHDVEATKMVFRRGTAGMKFFTLPQGETVARSQRWGFIHDNYHPLPNQIGQGKEGSSFIYDYTSSEFSTRHICVYAFAMDDTDAVRGWHIKERDGGIAVLTPKNTAEYLLTLSPDAEQWFTVSYRNLL